MYQLLYTTSTLSIYRYISIYYVHYIYLFFFGILPHGPSGELRTDMVSCATVASADFGEREPPSSTTDSGASGKTHFGLFQDTTSRLGGGGTPVDGSESQSRLTSW